MDDDLVTGSDGRARCRWGSDPDIYRVYHDGEWGRPVVDDNQLFEKLALEGFQAGLSWLTILRKRENFRSAFADFEIPAVAAFGPEQVELLLGDVGIVRNRSKIEATIGNAKAALDLEASGMSLSDLIWSFRPPSPPLRLRLSDVPATTDESKALSQALKKRGFRFVGPTTIYALMQAMGLVNDHLVGCWVHKVVQEQQAV